MNFSPPLSPSIYAHMYILHKALTHIYAVLSYSVVSDSLQPHGLYPSMPDSSVHGDSPGKNTGVRCHALLQRIFPSQGLNPGLLHCRRILYCLSHYGSQRILELVAYPIPSSEELPNPGIELGSPELQANSLPAKLPGTPIYVYARICICVCM